MFGPRPASWLLFPTGVTALLIAGYILMRLYGKLVGPIPYDTKALFHISTEGGLVAWWNSTLLLGIAGIALLLAALSGPGRPAPGRVGRASWLLAAAAAGYLSLDESAALHERLGKPASRLLGGDETPLITFAWVFPGAILAFVGCVLAVRWARRLPFDLRTGLLAALAIYFTGALGLEALNGWFKRQHADLARQLGTLVEESMEMAGCLIALSTFAAALILVREPSGRLGLALRSDLAAPVTVAGATDRPAATPGNPMGNATVGGTGTTGIAPGIPTDTVASTAGCASTGDPEETVLRPDPGDEMR